jgi:excisionase family DNA binding protein
MGATKALIDKQDTVIPSKRDAELATESSRILSKLESEGDEFRVCVADGLEVRLPSAIRTLLIHVLTEMSRGNAVTIFPVHAELTTQEAADYLNVSRPYLIKLLENGEIEYHHVGTHRRVTFHNLKAYRDRKSIESDAAMAELAAQAQELELGY